MMPPETTAILTLCRSPLALILWTATGTIREFMGT